MSALTRKEFCTARAAASPPSPAPAKACVTRVIVSRITGPPAPEQAHGRQATPLRAALL
jgi:hypothetical protein